jgi:hypothetical protein
VVNRHLENYSVYSKGFRGIPDGWHDLKSCNFLVGENSSGKSSFLQLIEIIDSRPHVSLFDICGIVDGLDAAPDICSRLTGQKEVTIGFYMKEKIDPKLHVKGRHFGRLVTYKETKGTLLLESLTVLSDLNAIGIKKSGVGLSYRLSEIEPKDDSHISRAIALSNTHFASERFTRIPQDTIQNFIFSGAWMDALRWTISKFDNDRSPKKFVAAYWWLDNLHYGPMRAKTRRVYHGNKDDFSSSGEHVAYILKDALDGSDELNSVIESFGKESGLYDKISAYPIKTRVKDRPFALEIERAGKYFYVDELGYGVGQILPIVADLAFTGGRNSLLIEQPELHLHPKAQAALGDVFAAAIDAGTVLVVETHSDFIIDRFRMHRSEKPSEKTAQIKYFFKGEDGLNRCADIEIQADGTITDPPDGYREFFLIESVTKMERLL